MFRTIFTSLALAMLVSVAVPSALQANQLPQTPPNLTPLDAGEPRFYEQFDCRNINARTEWEACWNTPDE